MKKILVLLFVIAGFISCNDRSEIAVNQVPMKWEYDVPATKYWEGLPIGTGRFAAMIPGNTDTEVIAFNDETLWTGGPYNPVQEGGPEALGKLRAYALARDYVNAEKEAWKLNGHPTQLQYYQPMARVNIDYGHPLDETKNYYRSLDMDDATVNVSYQYQDVNYKRQVFASFPDQVIVFRFTADKKAKVSFSTWLTSLQPSAKTRIENGELVMEGTTISEKEGKGPSHQNKGDGWIILPPQMRWQSRIKVLNQGGTLTVDNDKLTVADADAVTIILAGATNWVNWNDVSADEKQRCDDYMRSAEKHPYPELLQRHLDDFRPLMSACRIYLGEDPHPGLTTTQVMDKIREGAIDPAYEARYFQYGRYLMLCASREGTLVFNNHNVWLDNLEGRWQGRWTLNFNLQVDCWSIENANLPKLNESLLLFTENLAQSGQRTAKELLGCRGWTACHGTDVWFNTAPQDGAPLWATWFFGGVWLMQQLFDHYEYDPDPEYLKRIYPLMKGATEFSLDFLIKDPVTGYLVSCPSTSPENTFYDKDGNVCAVSMGAAGETQMIRKLFRDFLKMSETLKTETDASLVEEVKEALSQLPPHQIGKNGQLQEWLEDFDEPEPTHRLFVHWFAAYPDDDITIRKTPELAEALRVSMERRTDMMYRGLFGGWKINLRARLEEPEKAYDLLHAMLTDVSVHPYPEDSQITPSMEGNQGVPGITAGIAEMLMQSYDGEISLLPALPVQWKTGAVKGLRARGGYDVGIAWEEGKLSKATIKAYYDKTCRLRTKTPVKVLAGNREIPCRLLDGNLVEFDVKQGKDYLIIP